MVKYWDRLKPEMDAEGMGIQEVANALGISFQAVVKVRDGGSFGSANNIKAAKLFGVSSDWLATGRGPKTPEIDQLTRHGRLREHLTNGLGLSEDDDQDAVWLASAIDMPFEFCEALLCGKQEFTARLARHIEKKLALKIDSLDEPETLDDRLMEQMLLESSRAESLPNTALEMLEAAYPAENQNPPAYLADRATQTLKQHLKAISMFLKLLDDDGRDFASGVLAKLAKSPDSFGQAAAAIQGMIDLANGSEAKERLPKSISSKAA